MMEAEKWGSRIRSPIIIPKIARKGKMPYRKLRIFPWKRQISREKDKITASFASSEG